MMLRFNMKAFIYALNVFICLSYFHMLFVYTFESRSLQRDSPEEYGAYFLFGILAIILILPG